MTRTTRATTRATVTVAAALTLAAPHLFADAPATQPGGLPVVSMAVGSRTYALEVAADDAARERGLMDRDALPGDRGMLFVFPDAAARTFWMHNTRVPLDIVFADADGTVVSVHTMKPMDDTTTPSGGPAMYAVELAAGQAAADGVKAGDKLAIPPAAGAAK